MDKLAPLRDFETLSMAKDDVLVVKPRDYLHGDARLSLQKSLDEMSKKYKVKIILMPAHFDCYVIRKDFVK